MDAVILEKIIYTSLMLNFVFGLGGYICYEKRYYTLRDSCIYSLVLNGIFILVVMLLRVWM
jgi:hypothetical protein